MEKIGKIFLIIFGSISLVLGVLGIFLPLLPTTPFLLLTSFCYLKGSKRLYGWVIKHKIYGEYIHNYTKYKSIKRKAKYFSYITLWLSLGISFYLVENRYIQIFLIFVGIGVTTHLFMLKTIK